MSATGTCQYLLVRAGGREVGLEVAEVLEVVDLAATFAVPCRPSARTACLRCQPTVAHSSSRMRPFSLRRADR